MFRVFDRKKETFVQDNIFLSPNGNLYMLKRNIFGIDKLVILSQDRYAYTKSIDLYDKNGTLIYEGDYVKAQVADDRIVSGIVSFAPELSAYIILCFESEEYFTLGESVCDLITVIGNVFENYEVKQDEQKE